MPRRAILRLQLLNRAQDSLPDCHAVKIALIQHGVIAHRRFDRSRVAELIHEELRSSVYIFFVYEVFSNYNLSGRGLGMRSFVLAIGLMAILAGCTSNGTPETIQKELTSRWVGKPADDFFVAYGPADKSQRLSDGRTLYTWGRVSKKYENNILIRSNETCIVSFVVDQKGIIQKINRVDDSLGEWAFSYCGEQLRL